MYVCVSVIRRSRLFTCTQWTASTCRVNWFTAASLTWSSLTTISSSATWVALSLSKSSTGICQQFTSV